MSPNEYEMLSQQMQEGFAVTKEGFTTTHKRINALREDFKKCKDNCITKRESLSNRIVEVERQQAVDQALEEQEEKQEEKQEKQEEREESKKWDVWKIIIRTAVVSSIPLLVGIFGFLVWMSQNIKTPIP